MTRNETTHLVSNNNLSAFGTFSSLHLSLVTCRQGFFQRKWTARTRWIPLSEQLPRSHLHLTSEPIQALSVLPFSYSHGSWKNIQVRSMPRYCARGTLLTLFQIKHSAPTSVEGLIRFRDADTVLVMCDSKTGSLQSHEVTAIRVQEFPATDAMDRGRI